MFFSNLIQQISQSIVTHLPSQLGTVVTQLFTGLVNFLKGFGL